MRLLILGNADSWHVQDLQRAAGESHHIDVLRFEQLAAWVGSSHPHTLVPACDTTLPYDAVLVRTMPRGALEQVVFRMDVLGHWAASGTLVLNPPRSLEVAIDKYLALERLAAAGMNVPKTYACQSWRQAMAAFEQLDGDAVVKPLFGSEGRGIARVSDPALAERAFKMLEQLGAVIYVQQFIGPHAMDVRLFVLGQTVWAMQRSNDADWRNNISRGGRGVPLAVTPSWRQVALQAAASVGAPMAGVDVLVDPDGQLYVIEINAVPGWKALARILEVDVAHHVLEFLEELGNESDRPTAKP